MPRKHARTRVEKGLYREGPVYWACATAPGHTKATWHKIGEVGIAAARRERDAFAYKLRTGTIPAVRERITLKALADQWFAQLDELEASGQLRTRTVTSYKGGVKLHVLAAWGGRDPRTITPDDLADWHRRQRASGASAWSIRARWMAVRGLLGYALRQGHIVANPCEALERRERPKPGRPRTRYLSPDEIAALLRASTDRTRVIVSLLVFTGARANEALGLTWKDVDFAADQIHIRYQMTRSRNRRVALKTSMGKRDVIMMAELGRLLRAHKVASPFSRDQDLVLANGVGKTLGYSRLRSAFAEVAEAAKVEDATPHTCRHTFASVLIDGGATVEFVSQQLGHASVKTTWDIYVHLFRAREHAEAARSGLDAAYGHMFRAADGD